MHSSGINHALVLFIALKSGHPPKAIGSGFIIKAEDKTATGITAAHVLSEIKALQQTNIIRHRTALSEFLPKSPPLDLHPTRVRAICLSENRVEAAIVSSVVFDEKSDVGAFYLSLEEMSEPFFRKEFLISDSLPEIVSFVCAAGIAKINIEETSTGFKVSQELCTSGVMSN